MIAAGFGLLGVLLIAPLKGARAGKISTACNDLFWFRELRRTGSLPRGVELHELQRTAVQRTMEVQIAGATRTVDWVTRPEWLRFDGTDLYDRWIPSNLKRPGNLVLTIDGYIAWVPEGGGATVLFGPQDRRMREVSLE